MKNNLTDEQLKFLFRKFEEAGLVPVGEFHLFCRWAEGKSRSWILESFQCKEKIC